MREDRARLRSHVLWAAILVVMTVAAYAPAIRGGFIWDDDAHVTENPNLTSLGGLLRIWLEPRATPQYYPLVHTTFWVERHLFGLAPSGYHLDNVLLHALNAFLLWWLLARLSVPGAWLAAAIFALHPVHVESVAWVTERKNVLSTSFYLGAALCLIRFYRLQSHGPAHPEPPRRTGVRRSTSSVKSQISAEESARSWRWYAAGFTLYLCALLSKTVTASLPFALLILLWWKRDRLRRRDVVPLLPMFVAGACLGLATAWLETHHVGAHGKPWALSPVDRGLLAGRALWFYAGKLLWPRRLLFVYPRWSIDSSVWWQYLFPVSAMVVLLLLGALRRRIGKAPLTAVLFFSSTLVPALGFFNVFPMLYSWVADHFQYLASTGLIALFSAVAVSQAGKLGRRGASVAATLLLAMLGLLTWRQGYLYEDAETLWRTTIARNPGAWMAHCNLGTIFYLRGDDAQAETYLRESLRLMPGFPPAHFTLARVLMNLRKLDEAGRLCREERTSWPTDERTLENQGLLALLGGRSDDAAHWFLESLRVDPDSATAHVNLADILAREGRQGEADAHFSEVVRIVGREKAERMGRPHP